MLAACVALMLAGCMYELPDAGQTEDKAPMPMVSVMLQQAEGMTVKGENPMMVEAGSDAVFTVEMADGYKIDTVSDGAVYENGTVTVSAVRFPTTIEVSTRTRKKLLMTVSNNREQGLIRSSMPGGNIVEDTEVTLSVTPEQGMVFLGYSLNGSAASGAEIVCTSPEYTFAVTENVEVFTNYYNVGDGRLIIYDSNGGREDEQYDSFSNQSHYLCPHALINNGRFTREGHVLVGYNTEADGSGTFYAPGWNIIMPDDPAVPMKLYAQWLPETPKEAFTYEVTSKNTVTIKGYEGDYDTVVIPETIDGLPVTAINTGAFNGESFTTLFLSRNIVNVANAAIKYCKNFTTLYFSDTVRIIMDSSFFQCDNFSKLYIMACMEPRYCSSRNGNYMVKYQRLITAEGPKIIFHSGSNTSYGLDSALMEELLGGKYAVVNYGCNQDTPASFYYDVIADFINKGDIVVHCPEMRHYQWGYSEMNTTTWQIFEGAYEAYSHVDIRNYTEMFDSFNTFNSSRYSMTPRSYEDYSSETVNTYGDYIKEKVGSGPIQGTINAHLAAGGYGSRNMDPSLLKQPYVANLNREFDNIAAAGGKVYISFCAVMDIDLNQVSQTVGRQMEYKTMVKNHVHGTVISDPGTYVMPYKYFYNSVYHLNTVGSQLRTRMLSEDILAQLAKE